jgi:hypothetical protein
MYTIIKTIMFLLYNLVGVYIAPTLSLQQIVCICYSLHTQGDRLVMPLYEAKSKTEFDMMFIPILTFTRKATGMSEKYV